MKNPLKIMQDSWTNFFTGLGTARDKRTHTTFTPDMTLSREMLAEIYRADGIGRRVVELPATEMTRRWFKIEGDEDELIDKELQRLSAKAMINEALRWARLYGGSLIVIGADDSGLLDMPLNELSLRRIDFLHVFHRFQIVGWEYDNNMISPNYGLPEFYLINPVSMGGGSGMFKVHHSRVIRFDGASVPEEIRVQNSGWDDSVLQSVFQKVRGLGSVMGTSELIVEDFVQGVMKVKNLSSLLASPLGREQLVTRMEMLDLSRHVANTAIIDDGEDYQKHTTTIAGLPDLIDRFVNMVAAESGIPVTILIGQAPAGLNATGDSDIRNWYDKVGSDQTDILSPPLERLITLIQLCKDGPFRGRELETWSIRFNPLWTPTDKEEADRRKTVAETDQLYILNGVLEPEEVTASRFGSGQYSTDTALFFNRTPDMVTAGDNTGSTK